MRLKYKIVKVVYFLAVVVLLFSCSKEWHEASTGHILQDVKDSYYSQKSKKPTGTNFLNKIDHELDWSRVVQQSDSLIFIGINVLDSAEYIKTEDNRVYTLRNRIFATARFESGAWHFRTKLLIPKVGSRQEAFSGTMIVADAFSYRIGYADYEKGVYVDEVIKRASKSARLAGMWITTNCRTVSVSMGGSSYTSSPVCDYVYVETSGGGGGGGQIRGPLPSPEPKIGEGSDAPPSKFKLTKKPSKDPCAGRAAVNERSNLDSSKVYINKLIQVTDNDTVEYAYETIMTDTYSKTLQNTPIRTDRKRDRIDYKMKWGSSGITVGFVHSHPFESGPSPHDLFQGAFAYNQIQPASQKAIFVDYFTSTIVTPNYVYVVTVKDAAKWIAMGTNFEQKMNTDWDKYIGHKDEYLLLNRTALLSEAHEYAILQLYNDVVNIYRAVKGTTLDFKPLKLDDGTTKPSFNDCNP
jgi:hypothetical protein